MEVSEFLRYIKEVLDFVQALLTPLAVAAPIIAIVVDQILKRLPFWKDGYAGWANLILNALFSGVMFFASRGGWVSEYTYALQISQEIVPVALRILAGLYVTYRLHDLFMTLGIGKSVTKDEEKRVEEEEAAELAEMEAKIDGFLGGFLKRKKESETFSGIEDALTSASVEEEVEPPAENTEPAGVG